MSRPLKMAEANTEWMSANAVGRKLGLSGTAVKSMALAGRVRVRTEEAVLHLYNVSDVEAELAKKAQPKQVEISTVAK